MPLKPSQLVIGQLYQIRFPDATIKVGEYGGSEGIAHWFTLSDGSVATIPSNGWQYWWITTF